MYVVIFEDFIGVGPTPDQLPQVARENQLDVTTGDYSIKVPASTVLRIHTRFSYDGGDGSSAVGNLTLTSD